VKVVLDRSADLVEWARQRLPVVSEQGFPDGAAAIGVADSAGKIMGVVVFHDWQPAYRTMQVSAVAEDARWVRARSAFSTMFDYAFGHCGVEKLWSLTPAKNIRALRFVRAVGFEPEARLSRQFGDDDAIVSALHRKFYEQAKTAGPA